MNRWSNRRPTPTRSKDCSLRTWDISILPGRKYTSSELKTAEADGCGSRFELIKAALGRSSGATPALVAYSMALITRCTRACQGSSYGARRVRDHARVLVWSSAWDNMLVRSTASG